MVTRALTAPVWIISKTWARLPPIVWVSTHVMFMLDNYGSIADRPCQTRRPIGRLVEAGIDDASEKDVVAAEETELSQQITVALAGSNCEFDSGYKWTWEGDSIDILCRHTNRERSWGLKSDVDHGRWSSPCSYAKLLARVIGHGGATAPDVGEKLPTVVEEEILTNRHRARFKVETTRDTAGFHPTIFDCLLKGDRLTFGVPDSGECDISLWLHLPKYLTRRRPPC